MEPRLAVVATRRIDPADRRFAVRRYAKAGELTDSLHRMGIVSPLSVQEAGSERLILVDGYQRLAWARETALSSVPCLVYPAVATEEELWRRRLEQKLFGPELNLAEKVQVLARFRTLLEDRELVERILPRLGIRSGTGDLDRWQAMARAGDDFLTALAHGTLSERAALELIAWPDDARGEALRMLERLRCSASIQVEILEAVREIALRRDIDRCALLRQEPLRRILQSRDRNHRVKTQAMREQLFRWRFPRLSAREALVREQIAKAGLPGRIRILPPRSFEGGVWSLHVSFSDPALLAKDLQAARELVTSGQLHNAMTMPQPGASSLD